MKAPSRQAAFALAVLGVLAGCTHSVHQSAIGGLDEAVPRSANVRFIEAETMQSVFLASGNTDFADRAMADLTAQCPHGRIVGVEARHSSSLGFFVYKNRLRVSGYCIEEAPSEARAER